MKLLPEVEALSQDQLRDYISLRAKTIVKRTHPDQARDDPEEWMSEAAELAHAVIRLLRQESIS